MTHNWLDERSDGGVYIKGAAERGELPTFVGEEWLSRTEELAPQSYRLLFGEPLPQDVTGSTSELWPYAQVAHIKRTYMAPVLSGLYPRGVSPEGTFDGLDNLRNEAQLDTGLKQRIGS